MFGEDFSSYPAAEKAKRSEPPQLYLPGENSQQLSRGDWAYAELDLSEKVKLSACDLAGSGSAFTGWLQHGSIDAILLFVKNRPRASEEERV